MKITEEQLRKMIREALKEHPHFKSRQLQEGSDYTAGRQVILSAQQAAFDFEKEIVKNLGLVNPDDLHPEARKRFNDIVETMKDNIVVAVKDAVDQLTPFPRLEDLQSNSGARGPRQ